MRRTRILPMLAFAVAVASPAGAQTSPFLPDPVFRALSNEISGDISYEHVRYFTRFHRPMGGGEGYQAVEKYVEQKAHEYGLDDVRVIRLKTDGRSWSPRPSELWLIEPEVRRLAFNTEVPLALADYSREADVPSAALVDVGEGTRESDYDGKAVAGNVVLATGSLYRVMDEAVWKRGALGVVTYSTARMPDYPDQYPWVRIPIESRDKTKTGTWAFVLQAREGERLRAALKTAKTPFKVRAKVRSVFHSESYQSIVEGVIRGTEIHDQDIVLTGHLQEEMHSANDDASGCANLLELARSLNKMIDEGVLPRPRRDIRFWWLNEISASQQYLSEHPDEAKQMLANINQDMVGARQSAGSRVQFVTREPASRASYLGAVIESIIDALVEGNTSYLSAGQARMLGLPPGTPATTTADAPFSRPVLARIGTHDRYDARVIPFHNNTDHEVFNSAPIGVPGVTFTNWPDPYIHSSDDDLWQMDATQLKRNAVAIAGAALYLANMNDAAVVTLGTEMYGRALERMSRDAGIAMRLLAPDLAAQPAVPGAAQAAAAPLPPRYPRSVALVREAARRERHALESLARFTTAGGIGERTLKGLLQQLPTEDNAEARLAAYYTGVAGAKPAALATALTSREKELSLLVPAMSCTTAEFFAKTATIVKPELLHDLMAYEALNFVDGKNSYLDIFHAVSAEADSAGAWYYGTVTLEDIAKYLDAAKEAGIIAVKAKTRVSTTSPTGGAQ